MVSSQPVDLYYEEHGHGTPLVLVHGFPLDHTIWNPVVPFLSDHARVILPDLRGHGKSPAPAGEYSMRAMADDLLRLYDTLKLDCAVLVGHSMGGYVSIAFALAYPTRLSGFGLVASHAAADKPERRQGRINTAERVGRKGVRVVADGMPAMLTQNLELQKSIHNLILQNPVAGVVGSLKGMAERPDNTELLNRIQVPALVISGESDSLISKELSETTAQLLGRAWLVQIPGCGHMPMMESPEIVADSLLQLIQASDGCSKPSD
jgi:3-oxoadipate enol-lactonase